MKVDQIRELSLEELAIREEELRQELFDSYLQKSSSQLIQTSIFKRLKKEIARIKTIVTEKQAQAAKDVIKG
jgi:large subunit ribosomal protein L29